MRGTATAVAADASALTTVTFPSPYISQVNGIQLTISGGATWDGYQLSAQAINVTLTGFQIVVSGGPPGSTVSVYWSSNGA
jgi:hypothetical protein